MYTYVKFFQAKNESNSKLVDQNIAIMAQVIDILVSEFVPIRTEGAKSHIRPEATIIKPPQISQLR